MLSYSHRIMPSRKRSLSQHLKHGFIPHKGNGYHPHVLRSHHLIGHAAIFSAIKVGVVLFATLIPNEAFLAPNILSEQAARIIALTNNLRVEQGLKPLATTQLLVDSAQYRADDMGEKEYFSHASPDGKRLGAFLTQSGYQYRAAGENLAMGFSDADGAMNGWMKSPTHYANLVDGEFEDIGVGVRGGIYQGKPTVYLAQHFGVASKAEAPAPVAPVAKPIPSAPKEVITLVSRVVAPAPTPKAVLVVEKPHVTTVQKTPSSIPVSYDPDRSSIEWKDEGSHVRVKAEIYALGDVKTAQVLVNGYTVELHPDGNGKLAGNILLPEKSDELFRVVVPSTIRLTDTTGQTTQSTVDWHAPKIVSETPWERYVQAKSWFSGSISIFALAHWLFLIVGGFFVLALLVSMGFDLHRRHPHVALKAAALIAMLLLYAKW